MDIVILGAGNIGSYLASVLSKEEYNVTIIDRDAKKLEQIQRESDVATICGHGSEWKILDDLIENKPNIFIALTGSDETNLVACAIAKNLGYPQTVARVKEIGFLTRSRLDFGRLFFVDNFIGAEVLIANDILKNIINPEDLAIENFAHGSIQMRTILIPEEWKKEEIPIQNLKLPNEIIISLIRRKKREPHLHHEEKQEEIIFPHGNDTILPGDEITVIGETKTMCELHSLFKTHETKIGSVTIMGGSDTALHLGHILEKLHIKVKIIEKEEKRCEELAVLLPKTLILNHDGSDVNFLLAEQIQASDVFIPCTKKDEQNILLCLLGKRIGCKKIVTLISDIGLSPILRELDIHFGISEKVNIANRILSILHEENIISIASLADNQAKVLEIKVSPDSKLVGIPLSDLSSRLPKNLLIAAIENRGRVMIGKGNRVISPHDTVIIITSPEHLHELPELF